MKILLLNQYYPPDSAPTGQHLEDVATSLVRCGHEVRVVCSSGQYCGQSMPSHDEAGVEVCRLRAFSFGRRHPVGRVLDYLSFMIAAFRVCFGPRPDVVVCLTTPPYIGLIGVLMSLFRGVPCIHWLMDLYPDTVVAHGMIRRSGLTHRVLAGLTRFMLNRAAAIWTLGEFQKRRVEAYLRPADRGKVEIVPIWADKSLRVEESVQSPMRAEYGMNGHFVMMYSGNLGLGHDFDTVLDGARRLEKDPGVHFLFVGGGTRWDEVRAKAAEATLANTTFRPYAPLARLGESLAVGDAHVVSQLPAWQGCIVPSKTCGVFAVGRPVVFVGGEENEIARWVRESGAGFVVPVGDGRAFHEAVLKLRDDPELRARLGRKGRAYFEKYLCADVNVPKAIRSIERVGGLRSREQAEMPMGPVRAD